jgi:tRNA(Ile)-lysidine synthetase-like protein
MKIPKAIYVAVSGGPDSMAALDFLSKNHDVTVIHFNHGTEHGKIAAEFVANYVCKNGLKAHFGHIDSYGPIDFANKSKEAVWRDCRYRFFKEVTGGEGLVLAHNLDDAVETWLFSTIHGNPRLIPSTRDNILRPFLLVKKAELRDWCVRKNVPFVDDPANEDVSYPRVRLRKEIIPNIMKINPGIYKVIAKKYIAGATVVGKLKFWLDWVDGKDHVCLTHREDKVDFWLYSSSTNYVKPKLLDTINYHSDLQFLMNKVWCKDDFLSIIKNMELT